MIPALILFAAAYVLMLVFSKYRPYIALGAALIFIATGMLPLGDILPSIDLNVLLMIAGTMGLVALFIDSRMPELLARIRAALRYSRPGTPHGRLPESRFRLHDLEIEYETRTVAIGGQPVHLTQTEYNILALLAAHAGKLLTYTAMHETVWGAADPGGNKKLQVNMANLRRKLGIRTGDNRYIVNELGVGYRMQQSDEPGEG